MLLRTSAALISAPRAPWPHTMRHRAGVIAFERVKRLTRFSSTSAWTVIVHTNQIA
jgi:hypothetical protein